MSDVLIGERLQRLHGLLSDETGALRDTYRALYARRAGQTAPVPGWPVRPAMAAIVGALRIRRELDHLERQVKRDAIRLLAGAAREGVAILLADEERRAWRDRRDTPGTLDEAIRWLGGQVVGR